MKYSKNTLDHYGPSAYGQIRTLVKNSDQSEKEPEKADLKILMIQPGKSTSHHFHLLRKSWFFVLAGTLRVTSFFDKWQLVLETGDTLELDPGEDHFIKNIGTVDAEVLEVGTPGHIPHDKIPYPSPGIVRTSPPGRFWRGEVKHRIKICDVHSFETACHCHEVGVDAIGFVLHKKNWSQHLCRLAWVEQLRTDMSFFLVTCLDQPRLVIEILHRLRCDTLQWNGSVTEENEKGLFSSVRDRGYRVVRAFHGTENSVLEEIKRIAPWTSLIDGLVWKPEPCVEDKAHQVEEAIIDAMESTKIPWMVALDSSDKNVKSVEKKENFMGLDARESVSKGGYDFNGLLVMDQEKITNLVRFAGRQV